MKDEKDGGAPIMVRYATIRSGSMVDGPGPRTVIWFQGCSIRCPGCQNKGLWPANEGAGHETLPEALARFILSAADYGSSDQRLTITGGEPFDQPRALAELLLWLRSLDHQRNKRREIIVYTGYTWSVLEQRARRDYHVKVALMEIDILVDGPYIAHLDNDHMQWRGSSNQEVIAVQDTLRTGKKVLIDWDSHQFIQVVGNSVVMTGGMAKTLGLEGIQEIARCGQAEEETC